MKPDQPTEQAYDQPVAYDAEGRPLYAHPPKQSEPTVTQVVHNARPFEPVKQEMSQRARDRHERAKRIFPYLNLSEGEFVIRVVRRHVIGLVGPLAIGVLLIAIIMTFALNYSVIIDSLNLTGVAADPNAAIIPSLFLSLIVGFGMFVSYYVYVNNKFFLTNESVIQEIQISLFARREQTVSLASIEDASYTQNGVIANIFNYGEIRLSTTGDETTYRFTLVSNPKDQVAVLNDAVEAFKNGRPVDEA